MDRLSWEVFSDNAYVIIAVVASVAVVVYAWSKFNSKARSRYKS
ncbi:EYxxD motif small membrane protein [Aneurinibacillus soli]|nr:EYxxD motif small membrane protein [Aneurinibacillus soli]